MKEHSDTQTAFAPIFIVGAPRSGTTMLAVLMDRHSAITIPPETQFFTEFLPQLANTTEEISYIDMAKIALRFKRISDLQLSEEEVLRKFENYEKNFPNLFQALLEKYAEKQGKKRPGEKSPKHIEHVPFLLQKFPGAKVICIVRDGRDVVRSLLKVPWAEPKSKRRLELFCVEWRDYAKLALQYKKKLSPENFLLVKYENILRNPINELKKICHFIEEEFEENQLVPDGDSDVVPAWEGEWKKKASKMLDPKRAEAWRTQAEQSHIWEMNMMMGSALKKLGYSNVGLKDCPILTRLALTVKKVPYYKNIRPFSLLSLKILKFFRRLISRP